MGSVIARSASVGRIEESGQEALTAARARGEEIATVAERWIEPPLSALAENDKQLQAARAEDDSKHAVLLAKDGESDREIGAVFDEMWNALGRPSQSIDYDLIVNGGKIMWTNGDPTKQPALMGVLAKNIRSTNHPKLVGRKEEWAARIEAKAAAQAEAARPTEISYAVVTGLLMQRRTLAETVQVGLSRFKRDLKNMGMTEAQVHEIIPDAPHVSSKEQGVQPTSNPPPAP